MSIGRKEKCSWGHVRGGSSCHHLVAMKLQAQARFLLYAVSLPLFLPRWVISNCLLFYNTRVAPDCQSPITNLDHFHVSSTVCPSTSSTRTTSMQKIDCLQHLLTIDSQHGQTIREHQGRRGTGPSDMPWPNGFASRVQKASLMWPCVPHSLFERVVGTAADISYAQGRHCGQCMRHG